MPAINSASRYSDKLMLLYPIGGSWRRRLTLKYSMSHFRLSSAGNPEFDVSVELIHTKL